MGSLQKNVRDCGVNFSKIISNTHISATLYFWSVLKFLKSFITSRKFYESWIDLRKGEKFSPTCADFACCSRSMWQNSLAVVKSRRWVKALKRLKKESQWSCSEVLSHSLCHKSLHLMLFNLLLLHGSPSSRVLNAKRTILSPFTKEYRAWGTNSGISQFLGCLLRGPQIIQNRNLYLWRFGIQFFMLAEVLLLVLFFLGNSTCCCNNGLI